MYCRLISLAIDGFALHILNLMDAKDMKNQFKKKMLALTAFATFGLVAMPALAQSQAAVVSNAGSAVVPYVIDSRNAVATSGAGLCWRTGYWSPAAAETALVGEFPAACACDKDLIEASKCVTAAPAAAPAPAPAPTAEKIKLSADALFDFDSANLRPEGRASLDQLAANASKLNLEVILAVGHTDRIGAESYNKGLSERRAAAVKTYLVSKGIDSQRIYTEGKGKTQPVTGTACDNVSGRNALISCLQPDRRVEIELIGTK